MKIMKRNGSEAVFDISKIIAAIEKANITVKEEERLNQPQILHIASTVEEKCKEMHRAPAVEEIQEMVESLIMECRGIRGGEALHPLSLHPQSGSPGQHHGQPDSYAD